LCHNVCDVCVGNMVPPLWPFNAHSGSELSAWSILIVHGGIVAVGSSQVRSNLRNLAVWRTFSRITSHLSFLPWTVPAPPECSDEDVSSRCLQCHACAADCSVCSVTRQHLREHAYASLSERQIFARPLSRLCRPCASISGSISCGQLTGRLP
jgi:ferredoxin